MIQSHQETLLYPIRQNGKEGFIDASGKIIVTPQFDWVDFFDEGFARVMINGKYGFVDSTGKIVIEPQFDYVNCFHDGLASIKLNGNYYFIDKTGKIVFDIQSEPTFSLGFSEGYAVTKEPHSINSWRRLHWR